MICPICGTSAESFLPFGFVPRPNAMCPNCSSMERHRLLWLYLKERTNFFSHSNKVLDVAPISCIAHKWEEYFGENYISIDLASPLAKMKMDITDIKFCDNYFDWIICYHVLEHIPDDRKAIRELLRVLKPGGQAILQVPIFPGSTYEDPAITSPQDREKFFGQSDHVRKYGTDYTDRLITEGFNVTVDPYVRELGANIVQRYSLPNWEDIFLGRKPVV